MTKDIICFGEKGRQLAEKLNNEAKLRGIEPCNVCMCYDNGEVTLDEAVRRSYTEGHAIIFVGAAGIAVRAVSRYVKDKLSDSPVIVIDDNGEFVIPLLSGHMGGANKLASTLAGLLDAIPVITTSTDINGAFSADVFARENHLTVKNRDGIKKVSAKAIEGKPVTISIKDYPPAELVDIIIADETDREYSLLLSPKKYTVGIGLKKETDADVCETFVLDVLKGLDIDIGDVYVLCTIDIKQDEPALKRLRDKYRLPLITFEAAVLARAPGDFSSSEFVEKTVGVDNVCERAALLGAGPKARIICNKTAGKGVTVAVAQRMGE